MKKDNALSLYEHFIKVCSAHGPGDSVTRSFLEYQILSDFILTNTDHHLNNFDVLRDTNTLEFIGMAPIFDSGNYMFWRIPRLPEREDLTKIEVKSFRGKEMQLLEYVRDKSCMDFQLLPSPDELRKIYETDPLLPCVDSILLGYRKRIERITKLSKQPVGFHRLIGCFTFCTFGMIDRLHPLFVVISSKRYTAFFISKRTRTLFMSLASEMGIGI